MWRGRLIPGPIGSDVGWSVGYPLVAVLAVMTLLYPVNAQQSSTSDVHIVPRNAPPQVIAPPNPSLPTHSTPVVKDVDLVLVPVTVTDEANQPVTGMKKADFQVYEAGKPQDIKYFSSEEAPISIAVIVDLSSSMKNKIRNSAQAVTEFFKTANREDEFMVITFADKPRVFSGFTQSVETIQSEMVYVAPHGRTALVDAIYLGIDKVKHGRYERKALLVISDGGDNHSRYTVKELENLAKEADVQIYAIGIYDYSFRTIEEQNGPELLKHICQLTGGRALTTGPDNLESVAAQIGVLLRNQYVIGYNSRDTARDGKWHKIKVKLAFTKRVSRLLVSAKAGYYAPLK